MNFDEMIAEARAAIEEKDWEVLSSVERRLAHFLIGLPTIPESWKRLFFHVFNQEDPRY